ncbi:fungal-specific transcription factor domain-containing protein [Lipomyces arxii]|uniref:fungal-specific transcription factor domain-containing protein n=1 Tax=Lipomyces arxii TaxID=56418 RepID=UPI0034CE99AD
MSAISPTSNERLRRRTAHACETCRIRKTRCDGRSPCKSCVESQEVCKYREAPALPKPKGDIVLETLLKLQAEVAALSQKLDAATSYRPVQDVDSPGSTSHTAAIASMTSVASHDLDAIVPLRHLSATEMFLSWEIFDGVPAIREQFKSVYQLESQRPPMPIFSSTAFPSISLETWSNSVDSFGQNVNFWYPALHEARLQGLWDSLASFTLDGCLALLVVALGQACMHVEDRFSRQGSRRRSNPESDLGTLCFERAYSMIHNAVSEVSITAMLCLFYTAIYFSYLQRPLQTDFFLNITAHRCVVMLHYPDPTMPITDYETLRRIFWCCFILESDLVVELDKVPQSGCAQMESQIALPSKFDTHSTRDTSDLSTLYLLACISIRRLLNRIHKLLYSKESVTRMQSVPDMNLIAELAHQLDEWRDVLPPYLQFELSTQPAQNDHQGFLRQRYFAAKSVIYRPVFNYVVTMNLHGIQPPGIGDAVASAEQCLDAAYLHMTNLRGFTHTVVIDTWICALSMTGVALVLYIAWQTPSLKQKLQEKIGVDRIRNALWELKLKIDDMMLTAPEISPSVSQCVSIIEATRDVIH